MSNAVAVNDSPMKGLTNKTLSIFIVAFSVIEAVVTYFLVINPLFISPVYNNAELNEKGITYMVKLFGKTFASAQEIADNQVILSLSGTILNIVLIYIVITGVPLLLSLFFYKGYAFAKSYLTAVFGAKAVIGLVPVLIPFAYIRNSMKIFGVADAVLCIIACVYFVYINSVEYADDMIFSNDQIIAMKKRGIKGGIMFGLMLLTVVFEGFGMGAYGINWSIYLGWNDQAITQGIVLILLLAVALTAAIMYVREAEWANYFFLAFGGATAISNIFAVVQKVLWVVKTYNPTKKLANAGDEEAITWVGQNGMTSSWWIKTIFMALALVASAVLTVYAFNIVKSKFSFKFSADEKKPAIAVLISAGSVILSFVLTIVAITVWDHLQYSSFTMGAMDYMYFIVYGGMTLFLACAMIGGYGFTKFGTLALYLVVASCNFSTIFTVFSARSSFIAANPGLHGYNYIIAGVLFILSVVSCFGIIPVFAVKDVDTYLYNKRYS